MTADDDGPAVDGPDVPVTPPRRRSRLRVTLAVLLGSAALFVAGAYVGWSAVDARSGWAADDASEGRIVPEVIELRVPPSTGDGSLPMPDVRGLGLDLALEILSDTVLRGEQATVLPVPWAGPAGVVVGQYPAFGTREPLGVRILVSEPAVVPPALGAPVTEVVAALQRLGAQVEVVRRFDPAADLDVVLDIEPAAGRPLPDMVRIVASERRGTLFLSRVPQVAGATCRTAASSLGGQPFAETLRCPIALTDRDFEWIIGRVVGSIQGVLGLPDEAPADASVVFEIIGDGAVLSSGVATYGRPLFIDVATPDVLRLTIRARVVAPGQRNLFSSQLVLAELRLVGGADALTTIQTNQR